MKSMTRLATGQVVDVTDLRQNEIRVWDFAWALAHINRYLGHTPVPWSVLSHTGLCFQLAMRETKGALNPLDRLAILLHDVAEAYICDMPRPVKQRPEAAFFCRIEREVMDIILMRLGLAYNDLDWELVKRYDDQALHVEMWTLMPDLRSNSFMPKQVYESGYPELVVGKPWDYVQLLRDLLINLAGSNGGHPDHINDLFVLPDHLAVYAKPREPELSVPTFDPPLNDDAVLRMKL